MTPKSERLPEWFKEKYEGVIDFSRDFWASYTEQKRYGLFYDLDNDVQKVVQELNESEIRLVYFADESDSENPDISHVSITKDSIVEVRANRWEEI
tara:strand:+ start:381 stop:668 length:288 start_codon:yes stop_codon:yes gene_type:complete